LVSDFWSCIWKTECKVWGTEETWARSLLYQLLRYHECYI
jgi:hypothetical protein